MGTFGQFRSGLSKAKNYSLNQKDALNAVLLDGRLELTNNLAERTVKPFVTARKNFLFCDTAKGADASALCFSVMETAKRNGLDPFGYLLFLLQELPKLGENPAEEQLTPLLPWAETLPDYCISRALFFCCTGDYGAVTIEQRCGGPFSPIKCPQALIAFKATLHNSCPAT